MVVAAALLAACAGGDARATSSLTVERDTIGDTVVVRTVAGSAWGDSARLVEELRIGDLDGGDEYTFGQIGELVVGREGTIYVHDGAMKALRAYDSTGRYLRTIGGDGAGPGEYRAVVGLAVLPDGRLLLRDPRLGRIAVYSAAGDPLGSWQVGGGLYTSDALVTDTASHVYSMILTGEIRSGEPWPMGYVRLDSTGRVMDTIPRPRWAEEIADPTFYEPVNLWAWHPHGYVVAAFGARYAVELRRPDQPLLRIERAGQPSIPVSAGELAQLTDILAERQRSQPGRRTDQRAIPGVKPLLRALAVGGDGRIWVRPYMPVVDRPEPVDTTVPVSMRRPPWVEATAWDVFEPDGTFLGRIPLPPRATIMAMRGDLVWGTVRDDDDVPYVVRWRIALAADSATGDVDR